jgi:hypothetical protein
VLRGVLSLCPLIGGPCVIRPWFWPSPAWSIGVTDEAFCEFFCVVSFLRDDVLLRGFPVVFSAILLNSLL